jgi:hypothetical protein
MAHIRYSISIDAPRERIFPLIASGTGFAQWWAAEVSEDYATGIIELAFFKRTTIYRLKPIHESNTWTTEWLCLTGQEWAGTRLVFELMESCGETRLSFTHADWKSKTDYYAACMKVWEELMLRLKNAAEGGALGPLFSRDGKRT